MKKLIAVILLCNILNFSVVSCAPLYIGHSKFSFEAQPGSPKEIAITMSLLATIGSMSVMAVSTVDAFCNLCRAIGNLENEVKRSLYFRNLGDDIQIFAGSATATFVSLFILTALVQRT